MKEHRPRTDVEWPALNNVEEVSPDLTWDRGTPENCLPAQCQTPETAFEQSCWQPLAASFFDVEGEGLEKKLLQLGIDFDLNRIAHDRSNVVELTRLLEPFEGNPVAERVRQLVEGLAVYKTWAVCDVDHEGNRSVFDPYP